MTDLSLEEFMNHDRGGGASGRFLRGWRKLTPPQVDVWLHTKALFAPLWQHNIPQVRTIKDKDTQEEVRVIWSSSFNCLEGKEELEQVRWAYKGDFHPKICPICRLIEHVRGEVNAGRLKMHQPIFRFDLGDGDESKVKILRAAGMYNGFGVKNLPEKLKKENAAAGVKLTEAWKENAQAKCNYVFAVVDNAHPENGVQVAIETSLLGDKMKAVLRQEKERQGDSGPWNPLATPYAFRWKHHPSAPQFNDKYEALAMPGIKLSEDVRALIADEDPPDLARVKAPGKVRYLQEQLEQYALIDLPWGHLFDAAVAQQGATETPDDDATDFNFGANVDGDDEVVVGAKVQAQVPAAAPVVQQAPPQQHAASPQTNAAAAPPPAAPPPAAEPAPAAAKPTGRTKVTPPAPPPVPAFESVYVPCDPPCGHMMREDETSCAKCGSVYNVDPVTVAKYAGIPLTPAPEAAAAAPKA
jgi:hypothetical protein